MTDTPQKSIAQATKKPRITQGTVRIPPARMEQLRALAKTLGMNMSDTIGYLLNKEIIAGVLPRTIPGVLLQRDGKMLSIGFDDHAPVQMTPRETANLVAAIRKRLAGSQLRQDMFAFVDAQAPDFGLNAIHVVKKGTGINLRLNDQTRSFSFALAKDLADLIEMTVK